MRIDRYLRSIVVKSYNRRKLMKRIILGAVILLVVLIVAIVACALISYHKQPELTADEIKQLDEQGIWKERTSAERARIIEDNDEALKERIRMISNAKSEIILSTFDFRSDDSGKLMLGALIDAADRGVSVNVIVDGVSGFTKMKGNPDFKALASSDGLIVGSPVYYASPTGEILMFLDRLFGAYGNELRYKCGSSIASARRGGTTSTVDVLNKYFQINQMPVVSSNYWNIVHGNTPDEVVKDEEGMQTMRLLGQNFAWLVKSIDAAKKQGIELPQGENKIKTNYIR